jgi:G:T-mismatch repair DNA endonuclease (very short patch repair protein)
MSRNKAKGTAFETLIVRYLQEHGFPYAERRALAGVNDLGDITGTPGVVWECKNHKTLSFSEWLVEAEVERANANADLGVVIAKRRGKGDAGEQYAVMTVAALVELLKQAGY